MKYISGIHALNSRYSLQTCGDWHQSGIQWEMHTVRESSNSLFGDYGIEKNSYVPEHEGTYNTANHIPACLDLLAEENFGYAQEMRNELICNDSYTPEIFKKVYVLKNLKHWDKISEFMDKEYGLQWLNFLSRKKP